MEHSYTIAQLATITEAKVLGDPKCVITGIAPLSSAAEGEITFLSVRAYRQYLPQTQASAVLLAEQDAKDCKTNALIVGNPELSIAKVAELFEPKLRTPEGIHQTAVIAKTAKLGQGVGIGAHCVIGEGVSIADNTVIMAGTIIGDHCHIGHDCLIYSHVTLYARTQIGDQVIIHSGVVLGADGFGFTKDQGRWVKIPQLGGVVIGNHVEIGANTTIDRGAIKDTVIGDGVKIDNHVVIGHNVQVGEHTIIAGTVGVGGSAIIGRHCMLAGRVSINDHIQIADGAIFTGAAMVTHSIQSPGVYSSGTSCQPNREWRRSVYHFHRLDKLAKRVKKLEQQEELCDGKN